MNDERNTGLVQPGNARADAVGGDRADAASQTVPPASAPASSDKLIWPPPQVDIEAWEVVDLSNRPLTAERSRRLDGTDIESGHQGDQNPPGEADRESPLRGDGHQGPFPADPQRFDGNAQLSTIQCPACSSPFVDPVETGWWQSAASYLTRKRLHECWGCGWRGWLRPSQTAPPADPLSDGEREVPPQDFLRDRAAGVAETPSHAPNDTVTEPTVFDQVARPRSVLRPVLWFVLTLAVLAAVVAFGFAVLARPTSRAAAPDPGLVIVESNPTAGRVVIDGRLRGETPLQLRVPAGRHELQVDTPLGRRSLTLNVTPGATVTQYLDFAAATVEFPPLASVTVPPSEAPAAETTAQEAAPTTASKSPARGSAGTLGMHPDSARVASSRTAAAPSAPEQTSMHPPAPAKQPAPAATTPAPAPATPPPLIPATQPGTLVAHAPITLAIFESGKQVGTTGDRTLLSPGRHELEFVGEAYEVRVSRAVVIEPGRRATIDVEIPRGTVSLNAQPWAEVWAGDERLGETPLGNVSLPVGHYEFVFRHPQLGERRATAVVRASTPTRIAVSFE